MDVTPTTPSAPAAPTAPTNAPQPATVQAPFNDAFADLDAMISGEESPKPSTASSDSSRKSTETAGSNAATAAGKSVDLTKSNTPESSSAAEAAEKAKTAQEKPEVKPAEKMAPPELRRAYAELQKKHAALEAEKADWGKKASVPADESERKALSERLEAAEKRLADRENELKYSAFERSQEYKDRYEKPFVDAYTSGRSKVSALKVTDADGQVRQGADGDFDAIMRIADDDTAAEKAAEMFGAKAPTVLYHRERVQEMNTARTRAIEDFRKQGGEREKQQAEAQGKQQAAMRKSWEEANQAAVEKYPQWFKPVEGDEKGNALLAKGFEMADLAFSGTLAAEKAVLLHSAIRNKAAGFDRLAHQLKGASTRIAELEAQVAEFKKSVPGPGDGKRGDAPREKTWEEELEGMGQ